MNLLSEPTYVRPVTTMVRWLFPLAALVAACHADRLTETFANPCTSEVLFPNRLVVAPNPANIRVGDTVRVSAALPACATVSPPRSIRWSTSDTAVISVDTAGLVRARRSGTTTVVATPVPDSSSVMKGAAVVTVTP
jgi:Big-like domain-containing protein